MWPRPMKNVVQEAVTVGSEADAHGGSHFEVGDAGVCWKPCLPEHKTKVCELSTGTVDRGRASSVPANYSGAVLKVSRGNGSPDGTHTQTRWAEGLG